MKAKFTVMASDAEKQLITAWMQTFDPTECGAPYPQFSYGNGCAMYRTASGLGKYTFDMQQYGLIEVFFNGRRNSLLTGCLIFRAAHPAEGVLPAEWTTGRVEFYAPSSAVLSFWANVEVTTSDWDKPILPVRAEYVPEHVYVSDEQ